MEVDRLSDHKFKFAVIFSFVILLVILGIGNIVLGKKVAHVPVLKDSWVVSENGGPEKTVSLSDFHFSAVNRLDTVELRIVLPEYFDTPHTLMPSVFLCSIEAFLDDQLIYTYGTDRVSSNRMVGSGTFFIDVPAGSAGKTLTLRLVQNEKNGTTAILPVRCVPEGEQFHELLMEKLFIFTISILLVGIGFLFWCNGLILAIFNRLFNRLAIIGVLSILIGVWSITNSQAISLFSSTDRMRLIHTTAEYVTIYLVPVPFGLMFISIAEIKEYWRKLWLRIITCWEAFFFLMLCFLHISNLARFPVMLNVFHVNSLLCMTIFLCVAFAHHGKRSSSERVYVFALSILAFVLVSDVLRFDFLKYWHQPQFEIITSFLPIGMLQFVILAFIGFLVPIYDKAMSVDEKTVLTQLAYTDTLTGLYNRTKCHELFKLLDNSDTGYVLINFDVNGLKFINDTCGHQVGDKLLSVFATCLTDSFGDIGRCFRMGGDEFLVLIQTDAEVDVESAMKALRAHAASRSRNWSFSLRYSYGIARRSDVDDGLASSVYKLSDERMYNMKNQDATSRTFSELQYYEEMRTKK